MPNSYYNPSGYPATNASGSSASMRAELNAVSLGFDLLPTPTGNAGKVVLVNSTGTALTVSNRLSESGGAVIVNGNLGLGVTPSAWSTPAIQSPLGAFSGNSEFNTSSNAFFDGAWKYISNGAAARSGHASGGHYWFTAPSGTAGAAVSFTQVMFLDSSGNLGVGGTPTARLDVFTASGRLTVGDNGDGAIVTSATTAQTLGMSAGGNYGAAQAAGIKLTPGASSLIEFRTNGTERMRLDSSGNLGLGVTPSAWGPAYKAIQLFFGGGQFTSNAGAVGFTGNCFHNGSNWVYASSNPATRYELGPDSGNHRWFTAPSGTAGAAITFTQAMTLDSSGNLIQRPPTTPPTLTTNGELVITPTSNTNVRISYRGSDGVTRVGNITLA